IASRAASAGRFSLLMGADMLLLGSLRQGHEGTRFRTYIIARGADDLVMGALLHDMRRPSGGPREHEQGREKRCRDAAIMVSEGAVEIEIGEKLAFGPHGLFD